MSQVYGVRFGPYLKVGVTDHLRQRMAQLLVESTSPPDVKNHPAVPIFAVEGDRDTERLLHLILAPHLVHGLEWFTYDDEIAGLCERILSARGSLRVAFLPPRTWPATPETLIETARLL